MADPNTGPMNIPAPEAASRIPIFYYTSSGHLIAAMAYTLTCIRADPTPAMSQSTIEMMTNIYLYD
jgi:hypothetical protein